jgi:hypothetical protein
LARGIKRTSAIETAINKQRREARMISYRFFAIDSVGRVDRGFEHRFHSDEEAIHFAEMIEGAAEVEVMRAQKVVARVRHQNGRTTVVPAL